MIKRLPWVLSLLALAPACGSPPDLDRVNFAGAIAGAFDSDAGDAGADDGGAEAATTPDGATADSAIGADTGSPADGGCGSLVNVGPAITLQNVAAAPPTPQGGTIADGTYVSTKLEYYTGDGGASGPAGSGGATRTFTSGSYALVTRDSPMVFSGTYTTSGTSYQETQTCPLGHSTTCGYTSDGAGSLVFIRPPGSSPSVPAGETVVETWTRQ